MFQCLNLISVLVQNLVICKISKHMYNNKGTLTTYWQGGVLDSRPGYYFKNILHQQCVSSDIKQNNVSSIQQVFLLTTVCRYIKVIKWMYKTYRRLHFFPL